MKTSPAFIWLSVVLFSACGPDKDTGTDTAPPSVDSGTPEDPGPVFYGDHLLLAWSARGMNPQDASYAEMALRPPFATLNAVVLDRTAGPALVSDGLTVSWEVPGNTTSLGKTDFWDHAPALLGDAAPEADHGLAGAGLAGELALVDQRFTTVGIPLTPLADDGTLTPYPLALLTVNAGGQVLAGTTPALPVSSEVSCGLCHGAGEQSAADHLLAAHDRLHTTSLADAEPVRCGACHAQPDLGWPGVEGVPSLALALHSAHEDYAATAGVEPVCYTCHPGPETGMLRGIHLSRGVTCTDCHGTLADLTAPERTPWTDEPRCDDCHSSLGSTYQQEGKSFDASVGHGGVPCAACHGTPHGLSASTQDADNAQNLGLQGYTGVLSTCPICHDPRPDSQFFHSWSGR